MKSILETSCYLLLMTLICYISVEFVIMNTEVSDIREVQQYAAHFIEIYGKNDNVQETGNNKNSIVPEQFNLDTNSYKKLAEYAKREGMRFECSYEAATDEYVYYRICISGNIGVRIFNLEKEYKAESLVKCPIYNNNEVVYESICV